MRGIASSGRVSYTRVSASILYPDHAADPAEVLNKVASAQDMGAVLRSFEAAAAGLRCAQGALCERACRAAGRRHA